MRKNLSGSERVGADVGNAINLVSLPVPANFKFGSVMGTALDLNTWVYMDVAAGNVFTVPHDDDLKADQYELFPGVGWVVVQYGAGETSIAAADGVTLRFGAAGGLVVPVQFAAVSIVRCKQNEYLVLGGVA